MISLRGNTYQFESSVGDRRVRVSLGVSDPRAASRLANRVAFAVADGPRSCVWPELKTALPASSYKTLTRHLNIPTQPDLTAFQRQWEERIERRVQLGKLASSTRNNYFRVAETFFKRMEELGVRKIEDITSEKAEEYLIWRKAAMIAKGGSGKGTITEATVLSLIFNYAQEEGLIRKSPFNGDYREEEHMPEPNPFTPEEVQKMDKVAEGTARTGFLLLRWTGLRLGDVTNLTWDAIDWDAKTLKWKTAKRGKWVTIPLVPQLLNHLENLRVCRTGPKIMPEINRGSLYRLIKRVGELAGVEDCHPHRFRANLVCELLAKGATLFDVSQLIGDTHGVTERYYSAVTDNQQERVRNILESAGQNQESVVG